MFCLDIPNSISIVGHWFYDWQTLVSGLLALVAAIWAGKKIKAQIAQVDKLNREERLRRRTSTRAMLPNVLSTILNFTQGAANNLAEVIYNINDSSTQNDQSVLPTSDQIGLNSLKYPDEAINGLARFIECLDDDKEVKHMAELVAQLQVFYARYESARRRRNGDEISYFVGTDNLHDMLITLGTINFLVESLFNHARFVDANSFAKVGEISNLKAWEEIRASTGRLMFEQSRFDEFLQEIENILDLRIQNDGQPWLQKLEQ